MKKEKPSKIEKLPKIETEGTEKSRYEIKTMEKDIGELKKKIGITEAPVSPSAKRSKPPKELPKASKPKPSKPPKLPKSKKKKSFNIRKVLIPIIVVAIILLAGGGTYYWWNYLRVPKEEESKAEKPELEIPVSLIEVDGTEIIETDQEEALFEKLKEKTSQVREEGTFQRILIKKISPEKDHFLSFQEIAEILYINIPYNILNKFTAEHILFICNQEEGNRLGVLIKMLENEDAIYYEKPYMRVNEWEETMEADLKPIFLDQKLGEPAAEGFQDNIYKDIDIRYLNFPDPSLTIDYAVVGEYLVITTSKESMYGVIDKIIISPE